MRVPEEIYTPYVISFTAYPRFSRNYHQKGILLIPIRIKSKKF